MPIRSNQRYYKIRTVNFLQKTTLSTSALLCKQTTTYFFQLPAYLLRVFRSIYLIYSRYHIVTKLIGKPLSCKVGIDRILFNFAIAIFSTRVNYPTDKIPPFSCIKKSSRILLREDEIKAKFQTNLSYSSTRTPASLKSSILKSSG